MAASAYSVYFYAQTGLRDLAEPLCMLPKCIHISYMAANMVHPGPLLCFTSAFEGHVETRSHGLGRQLPGGWMAGDGRWGSRFLRFRLLS